MNLSVVRNVSGWGQSYIQAHFKDDDADDPDPLEPTWWMYQTRYGGRTERIGIMNGIDPQMWLPANWEMV